MSSRHPPVREAHAYSSLRYYLVLSDANITVAQIAPVKIFFMRDARRTPGAPGFEWSPRREAAGSQGEIGPGARPSPPIASSSCGGGGDLPHDEVSPPRAPQGKGADHHTDNDDRSGPEFAG